MRSHQTQNQKDKVSNINLVVKDDEECLDLVDMVDMACIMTQLIYWY